MHGVTDVFGIPGVHNIEVYRGLAAAGITHTLARHEQGVGYMADGYARATGRPGVGLVISGPGVTNIMTPMGQAYSDRVPLLIISSCLDETEARKGQLHQMRDQCAAAEAVSAWSAEATTAHAALQLIDRAFADFSLGLMRPVHIQIPISVLVGPGVEMPAPPRHLNLAPCAPDLTEVLDLLSQAKRPLFIFGAGAASGAAWAGSVVDQTGAACFTTYAGRGVIAAGHPALLGATLARPGAAQTIASADLVLAVGTELAQVDLWRDDLGHVAPLIRIDTDPSVLGDGQPNQTGILCDAALFLQRLSAALAERTMPPAEGWTRAEIAATRRRWHAELDAERPALVPIVEAVKAALPSRALIYSDMTQLAYLAKEIWDMPRPGLWHHPCGFGTLGYALPAAIGARVARPHDLVAAIAGDYGFQYTLQELGTLAELQGPMPIILWDNDGLKEIEDYMVQAQIPPMAVHARNPDFAQLARAYGLHYSKPAALNEIAPALARACGADKATIIHLTPDLVR